MAKRMIGLLVCVSAVIGMSIHAAAISPSRMFRLGDVNWDDKVDSADARCILKHAVSKEEIQDEWSLWLADADQNGTVDSSDAQKILQFTVGKLPSYTKVGRYYQPGDDGKWYPRP